MPNRLLRVCHYVKLLGQGLGLPADTCKALPKMIEVKNAYPDERAGMHELNFMAAAAETPPKAAPARKAAATRP